MGHIGIEANDKLRPVNHCQQRRVMLTREMLGGNSTREKRNLADWKRKNNDSSFCLEKRVASTIANEERVTW